MATKIINGKEVEVIPAEAKEIVKHKTTGKIYANKAEFDAYVLLFLVKFLYIQLN